MATERPIELPNVGDLFEDRYEILQVLGQGGFATVFRAVDTAMARDAAIKVLTPRDGGYGGVVAARFMREAKMLATLANPHIVTMYDFGETSAGLLFMVSEYVPGKDLSQLLREQRALGPAVTLHIVEQIGSALRDAHAAGVLHRDIKPANILAYEYGDDPYRTKLLDFGIAKDVRPDAARLTRTGRIVGTLRYMAPEQLLGEPVGPAADFYSLGLVAYEMLVGRPAIAGADQAELLRQQIAETPLRVPPQCAPPALCAVVERLMARDPARRYASADHLLHDLRALRSRPAAQTATPTSPTPAESDADGRPTRRALIVWGAALALTVTVAAVGWSMRPGKVERRVNLPPIAPTSSATNADERHDARPAPPPPADGCGEDPPFVGFGEMSSPTTRWAVYLPRDYRPTHRHPLAVMFHRDGQDGRRMLEQTNLARIADEHGLVLFALDSPAEFGWPKDTVDRAMAAIAHGAGKLCLDPDRLFVIGDDQGAEPARHLACKTAVSGLVTAFDGEDETCQPVAPTPRLRLFGRDDPVHPREGGRGCAALAGASASVVDIDRSWNAQYHCSPLRQAWGDYQGGKCWRQNCDVAPLVTCEVEGGHEWPRATGGSGLVEGCRTPTVAHPFHHADAIWAFFDELGVTLDDSAAPAGQGASATASCCPAARPASILLDVRSAFLRTEGGGTDPMIIDLADIDVCPKDRVRLGIEGGFRYAGDGRPDAIVRNATAVFSRSSTLLEPSELHRVPDAVKTSRRSPKSSPTYLRGLPTDIDEDFQIHGTLDVVVPAGATHLMVGVADTHYGDNTDIPGEPMTLTVRCR